MLAALATNLIRLAAYKSRLKKLEAAIAELDRAITANSSEIDYKKTDEYIDRYAREYLDMQDENDVTFKEEE
jgi:cell division protein FtsB